MELVVIKEKATDEHLQKNGATRFDTFSRNFCSNEGNKLRFVPVIDKSL